MVAAGHRHRNDACAVELDDDCGCASRHSARFWRLGHGDCVISDALSRGNGGGTADWGATRRPLRQTSGLSPRSDLVRGCLRWVRVRAELCLAGALSFPNGAAMVREAIPETRRGSAFGLVSLATGLAAASGPPLGGVLVHAFGWSAIFWANVPVVGAALILGGRSLPRSLVKPERRPPFDLPGSGLLAASLAVVIVIPTLLKLGQPMLAATAAVAGVALAIGFVRWELRAAAPVVDVHFFTRPHFAAACASIGLSNLVMYTTLLALPLYLEDVRGHAVQTSGMILVALSA